MSSSSIPSEFVVHGVGLSFLDLGSALLVDSV